MVLPVIAARLDGNFSGFRNNEATSGRAWHFINASTEDIEMIFDRTVLYRRISSVLCFTLFAVVVSENLAMAQDELVGARNWWSPTIEGTREHGKLSELVNKRKVYVTTSFTDSRTIPEPSPIRSGDVQRTVLDAFSLHKELQIVPVPSQADFAVVVRTTATTESGDRPPNFSFALDSSTAVDVEVLVVVPGSKRSDGTIRSRVVWESSSSNAQIEAGSAARFTVNGFLWEFSKLKDTVKDKAK